MKQKPLPVFRLRVTDHLGNARYVYRNRLGDVHCCGGDETALSLSYAFGKQATETRFMLEDCVDGKHAAKIARDVLAAQWKNNPALCPKVDLL